MRFQQVVIDAVLDNRSMGRLVAAADDARPYGEMRTH
jgi:hypothetical protein